MLTDLVEIGGKKYYFDSNGLMQRGMIPLMARFICSEQMVQCSTAFTATRPQEPDTLKTDGLYGSQRTSDSRRTNKYYFNTNGVMATGLTQYRRRDSIRSEQTAQCSTAGGSRMLPHALLQTNGAMAVNTTLAVGGVTYVFDANRLATAVPVINPATWVTDPADRGVTIDTGYRSSRSGRRTAAAAAAAAIAQK